MGMFALRLTLLLCSLTLYNWVVHSAGILDNSSDPWRNWPRDDEETPSQQSSPLSRRITPKSVFIAPIINACPPDHRPDHMGQCVKVVRIDEAANEAARLNALLQKLNSMFPVQRFPPKEPEAPALTTESTSTPSNRDASSEDDSSGPLHLLIPINSNNSSEMLHNDPPVTARNDSAPHPNGVETTTEVNGTDRPGEFTTDIAETTSLPPVTTTGVPVWEASTVPDAEFTTDADTTTLFEAGVTSDVAPTEAPSDQPPGLYGRPSTVASLVYRGSHKSPDKFQTVGSGSNGGGGYLAASSATQLAVPEDNQLPSATDTFEAHKQYPQNRLPPSGGASFGDGGRYSVDYRLVTSSPGFERPTNGRPTTGSGAGGFNKNRPRDDLQLNDGETDRKWQHHREVAVDNDTQAAGSISNNDSDISSVRGSSGGVSLSGSISSSKNGLYQKLPSSASGPGGHTRPQCDPEYGDCYAAADRPNAVVPEASPAAAYQTNANRATPVTTFVRFPDGYVAKGGGGGAIGVGGGTSVVRFPSRETAADAKHDASAVTFPDAAVAPRHWESSRFPTAYWSLWDAAVDDGGSSGLGASRPRFVQIWPGNGAGGSATYNIGGGGRGDRGYVRSQSDDYS